jgi:hypothetical protein
MEVVHEIWRDVLPRDSLELGQAFVGDGLMDMDSRRVLSPRVSLGIAVSFQQEHPGPVIQL